MSAGNHGQAVACHARRLEIPATVVMPLHTPYVKVQQTRSLTALKSCCSGETLQAAFDHAWELARKKGLISFTPTTIWP